MTRLEQLIKGLQIIHGYQPDADLAGGHDVLYVSDYSESNWSDEDKQLLDSLGFYYDIDNDCWARFV